MSNPSHKPDDVQGHDIDLHADDGLVHVHVHPAATYVKIFFALVFLTLVTVGLSRIHLGEWNFFIAVVVATIKASLVAMFFMHLKDDNRFNVLIFVGSLLFMGVFFIYTMNDTQHRGQWDESYGTRVSPATGEEAPGRGQYQEVKATGGHGDGHGEPGAGTPPGSATHAEPAGH
ncbi:MAG: cytochrome C oxidase subunit IV family protein [Polyangiales bacterium]